MPSRPRSWRCFSLAVGIVNDAENIFRAFKPFYDKTGLAEASDPLTLEALKHELDLVQVYHWSEVQAFAQVFYKPLGRGGSSRELTARSAWQAQSGCACRSSSVDTSRAGQYVGCMLTHLHTCKPGFEETLARELALCGYREEPVGGEGFLVIPVRGVRPALDLCFAVFSVLDAREVAAPSVNAMAGALCDTFWECLQGERLEAPWFLHMASVPHEAVAGRMRTVQAEFLQRLKGKMSRLAKLASTELPADERETRGFFVYFLDADNALAGSRIRFWGQRRMRDNPKAPSRAYLKIEEAFAVLGHAPERGETVVDLGAAPGGWSFSAAERGATVLAVDNGPLRAGALSHPRITHVQGDAFLYQPPGGRRCDWLLCDLIEDPNRVVEQILLPWLDAGWCRRFVVNLKVGKLDAIELLRRLRGIDNTGLTRRCERFRVRQLFHDREEITCMGETP